MQEELDFLKKNFDKMTYRELTEKLNEFNQVKKNEKQVRTKGSQIGLSKLKNKFDRRFFKDLNNEYKAYWLGFIFADGWVSFSQTERNAEIGIELMIEDKGHLEKFVKHIDGNMKVSTILKKDRYIDGVFVKGGKESALIRLYSIDMVRDLSILEINRDKTYSDAFPKIKDDQLFIHFLRGFFDGDGCIHVSKGRIQSVKITNANIPLLNHIADKLKESYGIQTSLYHEKQFKNNLSVNGGFEGRDRFLSLLYDNSNVYLDRKHKLYENFRQNNLSA